MIVTKTPFRVSLLGGGTDLRDYYRFNEGMVLSFTINKYMYLNVNKNFFDKYRIAYSEIENVSDLNEIKHTLVRSILGYLEILEKLEIVSIADIPSSGSGLGSSSAFTVGLIQAIHEFQSKTISSMDLAKMACRVEIDINKSPIGKQDQYAVAIGGFNKLIFKQDESVEVTKIQLEDAFKNELFSNMLVFHTNLGRSTDLILSKEISPNTKLQKEYLDTLKNLVDLAMPAIINQDVKALGSLVLENHKFKILLNKNSANQTFETILNWSLKRGAYGGKILGAGGGGFGLIIGPNEVLSKLKKEFAAIVFHNICLDEFGSRVVLNDK